MSRLEELIQQYCPDGVEYKPLAECCNILDGKRKPITKGARQSGSYPYYGANGIQDWVADYIFDGTYVLIGEDGSVITPNGTPIVNWAQGKIWVNNHAHIIAEKTGVLLRFLFYFIQTIDIHNLVHGNIPKLTQGDLKELEIPVPPLPVQEEIVRILDAFTELQAELQAELQKRLQQYNYYRDNLLSFEGRTDVQWKKLNEVATVYDGTHQTPAYKESGIPFISVENIGNIYNSRKYISREDFDKYKIKPRMGDVFMTRIGSIGVCAVFEKQADIAYYVSLALIKPNQDAVNSRYLKHIIESLTGCKELRKRTLVNAVPIKVNKDDIGKIVLPFPSLAEQQKIVSILDRFDSLTNDLTEGLPAEIEKRRLQYEYYRDKLLTFKRK